LQQEKSEVIIIVEAAIIKSGINRHITNTNMAGPGVIITRATTIDRHMDSGTNTIVGIAGRFTDMATLFAATDGSNARWCGKSTTIMAALKVMLSLKTSSTHLPLYRIRGSHSL
jgi:hypothetical protein